LIEFIELVRDCKLPAVRIGFFDQLIIKDGKISGSGYLSFEKKRIYIRCEARDCDGTKIIFEQPIVYYAANCELDGFPIPSPSEIEAQNNLHLYCSLVWFLKLYLELSLETEVEFFE